MERYAAREPRAASGSIKHFPDSDPVLGPSAPELPLMPSASQVSLWSRYARVQEIAAKAIQPVLVLLGPISCTTWIRKIIIDQATQMMQAGQGAATAGPNDHQETSKHNLKVHCYEFYNAYRTAQNPSG